MLVVFSEDLLREVRGFRQHKGGLSGSHSAVPRTPSRMALVFPTAGDAGGQQLSPEVLLKPHRQLRELVQG